MIQQGTALFNIPPKLATDIRAYLAERERRKLSPKKEVDKHVTVVVDSSRNGMAHDAREGKWRGNWWKGWVAGTLHTTSDRGLSSIATTDARTSAAGSRTNWRPRWFEWTRPFRRKAKSGFCARAVKFQPASNMYEGCYFIFFQSMCVTLDQSVSHTDWHFSNFFVLISVCKILVNEVKHSEGQNTTKFII